MKIINNIKMAAGICAISMTSLLTSCNFLDIVPVEQPSLEDATQNYNSTLGFLYSCYSGLQDPLLFNNVEGSADEYALPYEWSLDNWNYSITVSYDLQNSNTGTDRWYRYYRYINQIHLFLQELKDAPVPEKEKNEWEAEAKFMLAYYHFEILRFYGPCPIMDKLIPATALPSDFPGRSHYDYVTDWIVKLLDEEVLAEGKLPVTRGDNEIGRATRPIALALKSRVLLYAASPLWNGSFPFSDWKNVKNGVDVITPGYGTDLVSNQYDPQKWERARNACREALEAAEAAGHYLYGTKAEDYSLRINQNVDLPYVPVRTGEDLSATLSDDEFKEKVLMLRYMITAQGNEGNKEFVWQLTSGDDRSVTGCLPNRIAQYNNGTEWRSGWSGVSPLLNAIERFYTSNGKLPDNDQDFTDKEDWLKRAGVADNNRPDIINLCVGREPRFYAWMGFDQGDYSSKAVNGTPLILQMKDSKKQGYNPDLYNRNNSATGFLTQKFLTPNFMQNTSSYAGNPYFPRPLIRMAELYLNLAECEANLGEINPCLEHLNAVRSRAGVPTLSEGSLDGLSLLDWVKNERYIELWGEGIRYFDVRRWVEGEKYLSSGIREGLNCRNIDPTFEQFNTRIKVAQPYKWSNRQYMYPIYYNEVDSNPNLVQAPGY